MSERQKRREALEAQYKRESEARAAARRRARLDDIAAANISCGHCRGQITTFPIKVEGMTACPICRTVWGIVEVKVEYVNSDPGGY